MKGLEKVIETRGKKFLFKVEESGNHLDYLKYEELRNEVWAEPNDNMAGSRNMKCENFLHEGSSLFIGVFIQAADGGFNQDKGHLVGFSYGFVGIKDKNIAYRKPANLQFYSQYSCVRKDFEHLGLGVRIKEFQKEILVQVFGIYTITCTYDPLTAINAYRNIHHFGMEVVDYREAYYGQFGGLLNRLDIPCDRFFVTWDLKRKVRKPEYDLNSLIESGCLAVEAEMSTVNGRCGPLELETVKNVNLDLEKQFLLIEIPVDFYRMLRETDVEDENARDIPLEWREKTREAFRILLQRGYRIVDFRKLKRDNRVRDFYILKK